MTSMFWCVVCVAYILSLLLLVTVFVRVEVTVAAPNLFLNFRGATSTLNVSILQECKSHWLKGITGRDHKWNVRDFMDEMSG